MIIGIDASRAQLYRKHHGPLKHRVASWLVRRKMSRKARQAQDPQPKSPYERIVALWSPNSQH